MNSDFGSSHTIGFRVLPIAQRLQKAGFLDEITARDVVDKAYRRMYSISTPVPGGNVFFRLLTGISVFALPGLPVRQLQVGIFDSLAQFSLNGGDILHTFEFVPRSLHRAKPLYKSRVLDLVIGHPQHLVNLQRQGVYFDHKVPVPAFIGRSINQADYFIAPSEFAKSTYVAAGVVPEKIYVVPFGVDLERFSPPAHRSDNVFRVLFVGNVTHRKGIVFLLEAWKRLHFPDAELWLFGHVYRSVRPLLRDSEKYNIRVLGFVKDLLPWYQRATAFVLPTLMEGSAKVVYEAMACGLPVITTPFAGSIVRDGQDGLIVPACSAEALQAALVRLYESRDLRKRLGAAALNAIQNYSWDHYGGRVLDVYRDIFQRLN